jgi:hypothetical protein
MSWSFKYVAENKAAALAELDRQHAPVAVKALVASAIDGLSGDPIISVESDGHLAEPDNYQIKLCLKSKNA